MTIPALIKTGMIEGLVVVAAMPAAGILAPSQALAQADIRQEDRRADRQADRRADRGGRGR